MKKSYIEHFISMGFYHFRIKKYIEIRTVDALPIDVALGYAALIKGIIYNEASIDKLLERYKEIKTVEQINEAFDSIEKDGLSANAYGRDVLSQAEELVNVASEGLDEKEKEYLKHVRDFWNKRK